MRIRQLSAHFGTLNGEDIQLTENGLQVVVDSNESGKSTFVSAIVAGLYGLLPGNRGARSEAQRFEPLIGKRFDVELDVESGGRELRIYRNFDKGTCTVRDRRSQYDVTGEFLTGKNVWNIGQKLLGLSREQFLRSILVKQGEIGSLSLGDPTPLLTRIQQLVDTNRGNRTAEAAIKQLDEALRGYQGLALKQGLVSNEIVGLTSRIDANKRSLREIQAKRDALDGQASDLKALKLERERLRHLEQDDLAAADQTEARDAAQRLKADAESRQRGIELRLQIEQIGDPELYADHLDSRLVGMEAEIATLEARRAQEEIELGKNREECERLLELLGEREQFAGATPASSDEALRAGENLERALQQIEESRPVLAAAEEACDDHLRSLAETFSDLPAEENDLLSGYRTRRGVLNEIVTAGQVLQQDDTARAHLVGLIAELEHLGMRVSPRPDLSDRLPMLNGQIAEIDVQLTAAKDDLTNAGLNVEQREAGLGGRAMPASEAEEAMRLAQRTKVELQGASQNAADARSTVADLELALKPDDVSLNERFGALSVEDRDRLARYHEDRARLLAALQDRPGPAPARPPNWFLLGGGSLLTIAGIVAALLSYVFPGIALAALGVGLLVAGYLLAQRARPEASSRTSSSTATRELTELDQHLNAVAARLGYATVDDALNDFRGAQEARSRVAGLETAHRSGVRANQLLRDARSKAARMLADWGVTIQQEEVTSGDMDTLDDLISTYLSRRRELDDLRRAEQVAHEKVQGLQRSRNQKIAEFSNLCGMPGETAEDRDNAIAKFAAELETQAKQTLLDSRIAEARRTLLTPGDRERRERTIASWIPGLQPAQAELQATAEIESLDEHCRAIATRLEYSSIDDTVQAHQDWVKLRPLWQDLIGLRERVGQDQRVLDRASRQAREQLERWVVAAPPDRVTPELLTRLHQDIDAYLGDQTALTQAENVRLATEERIAASTSKITEVGARFEHESGVAAGTAGERALVVERVRTALNNRARLESLTGKLREIESALLGDSVRAQLEAAASALEGDLEEGTLSARDLRERAGSTKAELEALDANINQLERRLVPELDTYRTSYEAITERIEADEAALRRAQGFSDAAELAKEVLTGVAKETHLDWSSRLNRAAGEVLERVGGEHQQISFGDSLKFVVRDRNGGHEWDQRDVEERLSAGARDQVFLAIRLALTDYFSPEGDPLPLILDDPLITYDDARYTEAMRYLTEQTTVRQVIMLTCHAQRHQWWLSNLPDQSAVHTLSLRNSDLASPPST